ncbi:glycoside hydrolase family 32 protein [Deminuibacter soli]|uniref:Glycoside hydrolase family 32 protein n=1 Tax=Deminuibacter soli TaxID=2291815 RepID=A0A3E1NER5_9BACT|nr:glycoside hydrolase family 32 protein [Deminuibacter soli]RFM26367.1 glycoside hydrolase family 32 protein [Deminuibacter soli]
MKHLFFLLLLLQLLQANAQDNMPTYRPLFHFSTDSNWINDPNGLVYHNGQYHLFCQYNPFGDKWGHMSWAHAVSNDLFHWQQQPLAIPEFTNPDGSTTMIFSGCAVADSLNTSGFGTAAQPPLVAMYTAHIEKGGKVQSQQQQLAYSTDDGKTWTRYAGNPVLDIKSTEFRDPKIFWYTPGKQWILVLAKPDEYKVRFYSSPDLKQWTYLSDFGGIGDISEVWECPDITEVPVEGTAEKRWLLTLSAGHEVKGYRAMQYFTGVFNGKQFIADQAPYPLYVDFGKDYYAGITWNNIPAADGRVIMLGWANDWRYANDIPTKGFRGQYATPRVLQLRKKDNGQYRLLQWPVAELDKQVKQSHTLPGFTVTSGEHPLYESVIPALDISFDVTLPYATSAGIALQQDSAHTTIISYNNATGNLEIDRSNAGLHNFSTLYTGLDTLHAPGLEKASFRIVFDVCMLEVFVNNGEYVLTDLVFPLQPQTGVVAFANKGTAAFSNIVVKEINKTVHER